MHITLDLPEELADDLSTEADCHRALSDFIAYHLSHGLGLLDAYAFVRKEAVISSQIEGAQATLVDLLRAPGDRGARGGGGVKGGNRGYA